MNWSDLQSLDAFERAGSLQEAARLLGVNHTTVARRLRQLESDLGCQLVESSRGRLRLTNEGRRAAEAASQIASRTLSLERDLSGRDARLSGTIRVGLLDIFLELYAPAIREFSALHPEVRLELRSSGFELHDLNRREAEVVVRVASSPSEALFGRRVETLRYAAFASPRLTESTPRDELPWIGWSATTDARMTERWMRERLRPEQIRLRVESTSAMFRLARAGAGAAILPIRYALLSDELIQLGEPLDGFDTYVWILTHRDLAGLERVRLFMGFLADRIGAPSDGAA